MRNYLKSYPLLAILIPVVIYCLTLSSEGGQVGSFVALQTSIIQNHSFAISRNGTDTVQFGTANYIVYAPGFAFVSLPFAILGYLLDGPRVVFPAFMYLMDELALAVAAAISSYVIYRICLVYSISRSISLLTALTFALTTSVWPFSVEVFPHVMSMALALLSIYMVLAYSRNTFAPVRLLALSGLLLGVATLVEYATLTFVVPVYIYLILIKRTGGNVRWVSNLLSRDKVSFLAPFLGSGLGLNFLYNYSLFNNPFRFPQELYINGIHFYLVGLASHILFDLVSPYRGILLYSPILVLGFYGLYLMSRSATLRADAFLFLMLFSAILLFYSSWQGWDGGNSYGQRFLILGIPYLVIPISLSLSEKRTRGWRSIFVSLFIFSSFIQGLGAITNTSAPSSLAIFTYVPLSYSLGRAIQGKFAVWWTQWFALSGLTTVEISLASIFVFIWFVAFSLSFVNLPNHRGKSSRSAEPVYLEQ